MAISENISPFWRLTVKSFLNVPVISGVDIVLGEFDNFYTYSFKSWVGIFSLLDIVLFQLKFFGI